MKDGERIRMTGSVAGERFAYHSGDVLTVGKECSDTEARNWLANKIAEPLDRGPERAESRANRR